jgi:N-acetylmuramoyl-L-alanine amidase
MEDQKDLGKVYLNLLDKVSSQDRATSIDLAEKISEAMREYLRAPNRGVKRARFFVLKKTDIPAVLVEVGFLSNPTEEKRLGSPYYQRKIAQAIAGGLVRFRDAQSSAHQVAEKRADGAAQ